MANGKITTYASLIDTRAQFTSRSQSIDKINTLGFGIIYYWHWGWSYFPKPNKDGLKAARDSSLPINTNPDEPSSGRFMYIGLSVQLPTRVRLAEHVDQAKKSNGNSVNNKANALAQAIRAELTTAGQDGTIKDAYAIPKIIHVCSLFDLAPLESYYIDTKYALANSGSKSFLDLIHGNFQSKIPQTIGVNTTGSGKEAAGQGSPLKQGARGPEDWIMAAYWFLQERDPLVLAARDQGAYQFSIIKDTAMEEKGINNRVMKVIELFTRHDSVSSTVKDTLKLITINKVAGFLSMYGLKEGKELDSQSVDKKGQIKDFDVKEYLSYIEDRQGNKQYLGIGYELESVFSFEIQGNSRSKLTDSQIILMGDKTKVATKFRQELISYFTGIENSNFGPGRTKSIVSEIKISLKDGLDRIITDAINIKNRVQQLGMANKQIQNKLSKEVKKINEIEQQAKGFLNRITADINLINQIIKDTVIKVAEYIGVKDLRETLLDLGVSKIQIDGIINKYEANAKRLSKEEILAQTEKAVSVLRNLANTMQGLQSGLNNSLENIKNLLIEIDKQGKVVKNKK